MICSFQQDLVAHRGAHREAGADVVQLDLIAIGCQLEACQLAGPAHRKRLGHVAHA